MDASKPSFKLSFAEAVGASKAADTAPVESTRPQNARKYNGIDLDAIFSSTQDERLRKALIINEVRLAESDIGVMGEKIQNMGEKIQNLEREVKETSENLVRERKTAKTILLFATQSLSLRKLMEQCEKDAIIKLGLDHYGQSRRTLWEKIYFLQDFREKFHSHGIFSPDVVAEAAVKVYSNLSNSIHEHPVPTTLLVSLGKTFQSSHVKFINGLADIMGVIIEIQP